MTDEKKLQARIRKAIDCLDDDLLGRAVDQPPSREEWREISVAIWVLRNILTGDEGK